MGQLLWALFTTRWPAMRGHSMALSGLSVALLLATVSTTVQGQDMMSGTMQCQCSCASDCTSGDSVTCDCPEPAYACAPGCWSLSCWNVTKVPWRRGSSNNDNNNNDNTSTTCPCNRAVRHWPSQMWKGEIPMQDDCYIHGRLQLCHKGGS